MRIGVLPLSGEQDEEVFAQQIAALGLEQVILHELTDLAEIDGFLLVGTHGLLRDMPSDSLMHGIHLQSERGKPVLGVGLGAQLLVEQGLVPGLENNKPAIRLIEERTPLASSALFIKLTPNYQRNAFTRHTTLQEIYPVSFLGPKHQFVMSQVLYDEIQHQGLNVWFYCTEKGEVLNNKVENVAAISNKRGNILALAPAFLQNDNGQAIIASMRDYLQKALFSEVAPLNYYPR